jgi:hypothetical protein
VKSDGDEQATFSQHFEQIIGLLLSSRSTYNLLRFLPLRDDPVIVDGVLPVMPTLPSASEYPYSESDPSS